MRKQNAISASLSGIAAVEHGRPSSSDICPRRSARGSLSLTAPDGFCAVAMSWAPSPIGLPDQPDVAARIGAYALFLHTAAAARPRQFGCVHRILIVKTETGKRRKFWLTQEMADVLKRLPPKRIAKGRHKGELRGVRLCPLRWADRSTEENTQEGRARLCDAI
jgi:hypothetical protein